MGSTSCNVLVSWKHHESTNRSLFSKSVSSLSMIDLHEKESALLFIKSNAMKHSIKEKLI